MLQGEEGGELPLGLQQERELESLAETRDVGPSWAEWQRFVSLFLLWAVNRFLSVLKKPLPALLEVLRVYPNG